MHARVRLCERGAASTELVLATPALLFLIMLLVQTGLWFHAQHVAQAAAQEGLQATRVEHGTEAAGTAQANEFLDQTASEILLDRSVVVARGADIASVEITGTAVNVVPGLQFSVTEYAEGPVERFRPAG